MTLTTERQQFEEWFHEEIVLHISTSNEAVVRLMWKAWQASRELLANREAQTVAWRHDDGPFAGIAITRAKSVADSWIAKGWTVTPLYTAPPAPAVQDGWIPCSEQTPVADGAYWCWFGKEKPSVIQQRVCIWNDRNHEWCDSAVTHWMPLPAAPEGGN